MFGEAVEGPADGSRRRVVPGKQEELQLSDDGIDKLVSIEPLRIWPPPHVEEGRLPRSLP